MIADRSDYDVAIVGASIAGSTAATLLARRGARVALIDRRPDPNAFKRVCGHYIQASAVPTIERLGLLDELEGAGAFRGRGRLWTRYGWIKPELESGTQPEDDRAGTERRSLSIRREILDPILRRTAAEVPGVDLMLGSSVEALIGDGGRARGVELRRGRKAPTRIKARVIVGADGRGSRTAALAGLKTSKGLNRRFAYWGYFEGPGLSTGASVHIWFLEPDVAIVTPTDSDLTLYVAFPDRSRIPEFKRDTEGALRAFISALPNAPPISESRLVGSMAGKLDLTNEWRRPAGRDVALIGDAALAADPVGAVGCGWALQSAEWLADALGPAIAGEEPITRALRRYRRRHRRELLGHRLITGQFARSPRLGPLERLMFSAAVHDPRTADRVEALASRLIGPRGFATPAAIGRAAAVNLRRRGGRSPVPAMSRAR